MSYNRKLVRLTLVILQSLSTKLNMLDFVRVLGVAAVLYGIRLYFYLRCDIKEGSELYEELSW